MQYDGIILLIVALCKAFWTEFKNVVAALWSELKCIEIKIAYKGSSTGEPPSSDQKTAEMPSSADKAPMQEEMVNNSIGRDT